MLHAENLYKTYRRHAEKVNVLNGLNMQVHEAEFLSIVGASGSGKSTLLHLLGTLDKPDQGTIQLDGKRIDNLQGPRADRLRNQIFGFIFQFYQFVAGTLDVGERADAVDGWELPSGNWWGRRSGRKNKPLPSWSELDSDTGSSTDRVSFPAAKCSERPLPAPWSPGRASSSRTSRPVIWTPRPARRSSSCCAT